MQVHPRRTNDWQAALTAIWCDGCSTIAKHDVTYGLLDLSLVDFDLLLQFVDHVLMTLVTLAVLVSLEDQLLRSHRTRMMCAVYFGCQYQNRRTI